MNKKGQMHILGTAAILLVLIITLAFFPRISQENSVSGRQEHILTMLLGFLRAEISVKTSKAFDSLRQSMELNELQTLENIESIFNENYLLKKEIAEKYLTEFLAEKVIKFTAMQPKYDLEAKPLAELTSFSQKIEYEFQDPVNGRISNSISYSLFLKNFQIGKAIKADETSIFYKVEASFYLASEKVVRDNKESKSITKIKCLVFICNLTNNNRFEIEQVMKKRLESNNGHYALSILIRPEYFINFEGKTIYLLLLVKTNRGEALWKFARIGKA